MTVSSGLRCAGSCRSSGPLGCLERTLLASSAWRSTIVLLTWSVSATPSGRSLFRLRASVPPTSGPGASLWRTPNTMDGMAPKSPEALAHEMEHRPGRSEPNNLRDQVACRGGLRMWPTPQVVMPDHSETRTLDEMGRMVTTNGDDYSMNLVEAVRMWPTPMSYSPGNTHAPGLTKLDIEVRGLYPGEKYGSKMLYTPNALELVRMYPTPTSRDHKDTGDYRETREGRNSCNSLLGLAVGPTKTNGSLAPEFVEYLQGFPIGYTALEPSETPSSRHKSTRSSKRSPTSSEG